MVVPIRQRDMKNDMQVLVTREGPIKGPVDLFGRLLTRGADVGHGKGRLLG